MSSKTADICDAFPDEVLVAEPLFQDYGGVLAFSGPVVTLEVFEDNALVADTLEEPGEGRVLVVDGGGSTSCALVGERLARLARGNRWAGLIIYGCIRDAAEVADVAVGVKALATSPRPPGKSGRGGRDRPVHFAGVTFRPGYYVYADRDGIVVAARNLSRHR